MGHTAWAPEGREGRYQAGPKGRSLEVGARRAPRLLVLHIFVCHWAPPVWFGRSALHSNEHLKCEQIYLVFWQIYGTMYFQYILHIFVCQWSPAGLVWTLFCASFKYFLGCKQIYFVSWQIYMYKYIAQFKMYFQYILHIFVFLTLIVIIIVGFTHFVEKTYQSWIMCFWWTILN